MRSGKRDRRGVGACLLLPAQGPAGSPARLAHAPPLGGAAPSRCELRPKAIGDFAGHRSARSTEVYAKCAVEALREVALGGGETLGRKYKIQQRRIREAAAGPVPPVPGQRARYPPPRTGTGRFPCSP
jgi:hypothetical protein